jgi:hypothetical protein
MQLAAAALVAGIAGAAQAGAPSPTCTTPQGYRITLAGPVYYNEGVYVFDVLGGARLGLAFRHVNETTPGLSWFSAALELGDSTALSWPTNQALALELRDSSVVLASELVVMTPAPVCQPIQLYHGPGRGAGAIRVAADELAQKRFRHGPVCVVMLLAVPRALELSRIAGLRAGAQTIKTPAPAAGDSLGGAR